MNEIVLKVAKPPVSFVAVQDYVLLEQLPPMGEMAEGSLPTFRVLAIGPGAWDSGNYVKTALCEGDIVYQPMSGVKVVIDGNPLLLTQERVIPGMLPIYEELTE